jgi:hypothetical protein
MEIDSRKVSILELDAKSKETKSSWSRDLDAVFRNVARYVSLLIAACAIIASPKLEVPPITRRSRLEPVLTFTA